MEQKVFAVGGLAFGDEGKGTIVEYFTRLNKAAWNVRYCGGPQALHHVVTPEGIVLKFSQFGSGSLVPSTKTYLSRFMLIDPFSMEREASFMQDKLSEKCFMNKMHIDEDCIIVTPFHKYFGRALEELRGKNRHGSCGMGVGNTVKDFTNYPEISLYAKDLVDKNLTRKKLNFFQLMKHDILEQLIEQNPENDNLRLSSHFFASCNIEECVEKYFHFMQSGLKIVDRSHLRRIFDDGESVVFEGAQGALLDFEYGFYPHVTKTRTTFANVDFLLEEAGYTGQLEKIGVIRAYHTRHGAGPFVTEDESLGDKVPEIHNGFGKWQGKFRIGYFDLVAARYALDVVGKIDGIALTNIDRLAGFSNLKICQSYSHYSLSADDINDVVEVDIRTGEIIGIKKHNDLNQERRNKLTELLFECRPVFKIFPQEKRENEREVNEYIEYLQCKLKNKFSVLSFGSKAKDKINLNLV